ncbi:MAG TPA: hypothetical protein ENJ00_07500 [Phycisphaerales bacterium]|nr:hypothetical protein [Phycisphaerales bacterium]
MNLQQFFEHWGVTENPFRGEEARQDAVFRRLSLDDGTSQSSHAAHSDFEKILGQLEFPSTSIVFGEKGSGKTAIRMQIARRIAEHNKAHPDRKVMLVAYDELNSFLDRFHARTGATDPLESFGRLRLVDHIDAILMRAVPGVVDAVIGETASGRSADLGEQVRRRARALDPTSKRDLLLLQALYDRPDNAHQRTGKLRRALRLGLPRSVLLWNVLAFGGWVLPVGVLVAFLLMGASVESVLWQVLFGVTLLVWVAFLFKRFVWDAMALRRVARRVRRQIRVSSRPEESYVASFGQIDPVELRSGALPTTDSDDTRYALLSRFRQALRGFGYSSMIVVIDRIDEPTLVNGDADRMRAIIWPLLNNKFLQQDGLGVKMLLPIELRHALYKESTSFFQEARLDKQNLVERLTWSGSMLYDLCESRLAACRTEGADPISLLDLFAEDVTRQDLVDALDQMHQPRDAFKFLYACLNEHCSNVTSQEQSYRVPRLVLETVRKQQADRVQQLYRGIGPA